MDFIQNYHLNADECYMVGDKDIDAEAGRNAGIKGVMIRSNKTGDYDYFKNLLEFAASLKK